MRLKATSSDCFIKWVIYVEIQSTPKLSVFIFVNRSHFSLEKNIQINVAGNGWDWWSRMQGLFLPFFWVNLNSNWSKNSGFILSFGLLDWSLLQKIEEGNTGFQSKPNLLLIIVLIGYLKRVFWLSGKRVDRIAVISILSKIWLFLLFGKISISVICSYILLNIGIGQFHSVREELLLW